MDDSDNPNGVYDDRGIDSDIAEKGPGPSGDEPGHGGRRRAASPSPRRRFPSMAERRSGGLRHTRPELRGSEENPHKPSAGKVGPKESSLADQLGDGFNPMADAAIKANPMVRLLALLARNKRRTAIGGTASGLIVGFMILFGIAQGPLQFINFAQLLQEFHLRHNEDFGDKRAMKILLYGITGHGAENGRLGLIGNAAANVWEGRLVEQAGMRPVFSERTGRFQGFVIENDARAQDILGSSTENLSDRKTAKLEASLGKGAKIINAGEAVSSGGDYLTLHGERLPGESKVLYLKDVPFSDKRLWIRTIGKATGTNRLASAVGSRLLIKRGGVNFHPLEKIGFRQWLDKRGAKKASKEEQDKLKKEYEKELEDKRLKADREGVQALSKVAPGETKDSEGHTTTAPEDVSASEDATKLIDQFKTTGVVKVAGVTSAVVGVLCAAKTLGDHIEDYKYVNNALPMMRIGWDVVAEGNQIMSGDVSMDELAVFAKSLFDKDTNTSWASAMSIKANLGQDYKHAPGLSAEAQLKNVKDKPAFFDALDSIGPLGTVCGAVDTFMGLPVISNIVGVIGTIQSAILDAGLGLGGLSVAELTNDALAAVSGKSTDPTKKGATYGAMADTGVHLDGISQAASTGGVAQSTTVSAQLDAEDRYVDAQENKTKSLAERYLDPYNPHSLVASMVVHAPESTSQLASLVAMPFAGLKGLVSSFGSLVSPTVSAAPSDEDIYGVPEFGFSLAEQNDSRFENPYDNAKIMEAHDNKLLNQANDKWGKCFGMRVTADNSGVHIETQDQQSDEVNVFKVMEDKDCQHPSASIASADDNPPNQKNMLSKLAFWKSEPAVAATPAAKPSKDDLLFERYRFYVADSVNAVSLACVEANDGNACNELGFTQSQGNNAGTGPVSPGTLPDGDPQSLAQDLLPFIKQGKLFCGSNAGGSGAADCTDIQNTAKGIPVGGNCAVKALTPHLLGLILGLVRDDGWTLGISAMCSDHHVEGDGPYAGHTYGSVADFSVQNGKANEAAASDEKFVDDVAALLSSVGGSFGQVGNCHPAYPSQKQGNFTLFEDSCTHQHVRAAP